MSNKQSSYRLTVVACCFGYLLQAVAVNVSPILFVTLREQFHLTYSQLGSLVLANFVTQLGCDLLFGGMIDRHGFRPFALAAPTIAGLGFIAFAVSPYLLPQNPFPGFFLGTMLFAGSGGLMEVLLSPIVNALPLPQEKKSSLLSVVHSAYSWGQVIVVLLTTLLLSLLGAENWSWIPVFWCLTAAASFLLFLLAPLPENVPEEKQEKATRIFHCRSFWLCMLIMTAGGAGELVISQWASSFIEKGLSVSKAVGDIAGVCAFAASMGLGRTLYSRLGEKVTLTALMRNGLWLLFFCYLAIGFVPGQLVPVLAIVLSGVGVSMLWPGTLVMAAEFFPSAGAWMFALLAAGGDVGCSFGPWFTGKVMDICTALPAANQMAQGLGLTAEQFSLRCGMLVGALFPLLGLIALAGLSGIQKKKRLAEQE